MPKVPATTDTQGRLRVSQAQRRDLLAALAHSGESLPRFARQIGFNPNSDFGKRVALWEGMMA
jgi:hypothetical protein